MFQVATVNKSYVNNISDIHHKNYRFATFTCTNLCPFQSLVYCTNLVIRRRVHSTDKLRYHILHMDMKHFPGPSNNPSKKKTEAGLEMTDIKYKRKALFLSRGYKLRPIYRPPPCSPTWAPRTSTCLEN